MNIYILMQANDIQGFYAPCGVVKSLEEVKKWCDQQMFRAYMQFSLCE